VNRAGERLRAWPAAGKTLYFASSGEKEIADDAAMLADSLQKNPSAGLRWHYERMPEEQHSTIYHPAALRAFRALFEPAPRQ
jgi:hypothetical protein